MRIALNDDGAFTLDHGKSIDALIFDPSMNGGGGGWILCSGGPTPKSSFHKVATYDDLDDGLVHLAGQPDFEVSLGRGTVFRRPGTAPALDVLASLGFGVCRYVFVYAMVAGGPELGTEGARLLASEKLFGTIATVEDIDYVGEPDRVWCFRARIATEGVFRVSELEDLARGAISDCDVEVTDMVEVEYVHSDPGSIGKVVPLRRSAA